MFSLIFVLCFPTGQCVSSAAPQTFLTRQSCETAAEIITSNVRAKAEEDGVVLAALLSHCVNWGVEG